MTSLLDELKRRKVFQVAAVYLVVAWLVMQVVDVVAAPLRLPEWFATVALLILAIGFPIALITSWAYDVRPSGVVRDEGLREITPGGGLRLEYVLIGLLVVAVGWLLYRDIQPASINTAEIAEPMVEPAGEEAPREVLPNSVAVLPFVNLSPDPNNAFFALGMHDTILNELANIADINVIARNSVMRYQDGGTPIDQIAEELNVETVMEGTAQFAENTVRITAQLIDPATGAHLWSQNYDRDYADIFVIQSDIATQIAGALEAELTPEEQQGLETAATTSGEAAALFLRAWEPSAPYHIRIPYLSQAIDLDPGFANAYARRAYLNASSLDDVDSIASEELERQVFADAGRALELDPQSGFAHAAIAVAHADRGRTLEAAEAFESALALSPNDAELLDRLAVFSMLNRDYEYSVQLARRAVELDPNNADLQDGLGDALLSTHDLAGASAAFRRAIDLGAADPTPHFRLAFIELQLGNTMEAYAELSVFEALAPEELLEEFQIRAAYGYSLLGQSVHAARRIAQAQASLAAGELIVGPFELAVLSLAQRDSAQALERVNEGTASGERMGRYLEDVIGLNLYNDPILERPEFLEIRRRLGYVD